MLDSAYARVAIFSLNKWGGKTIEQAQETVANHSRDEVEGMTKAQASVDAGFDALVDAFRNMGMDISDELKEELHTVILDGPNDAPIMEEFKKSLGEIDKETLTLDTLEAIHDAWVSTNEAKVGRPDKGYMHAPIEMLGWESLELDYIFLKPVMETMGVQVDDDKKLIEKYGERQAQYFEKNGIKDKESLAAHIKLLPEVYEPLANYSEENKNRFGESKILNEVIKNTGFEKLMANKSVVQESSLAQKAEELKAILDEQKKLDSIPLPDRTLAKNEQVQSYGE